MVEKAGDGDIAQVVAIIRQHREVFPFLPRSVFEEAAQRGELIVCRQDQQVVGLVHYHHRRDGTTTVHEIAAAPGHSRNGVGRRLIDALLSECALKGQTALRLKCPVDLPANGFYERIGFHRVGIDAASKRPLAVREMAVPQARAPRQAWQFYASMTNSASEIRGLIRRFYEGYEGNPPFNPFERIIFTPLFTAPAALRLFRALKEPVQDPARTLIPFTIPTPAVMFDSGGYHVQMGKTSFEDLCLKLRALYEEELWADWYVLPDHVPASSDSDPEVECKVRQTLAMGENFLAWLPHLAGKVVGVVHGRTEAQVRRGARHWHGLGVRYLAFGSFGTSGKNGSVNMLSHQSLATLKVLYEETLANGQELHVFGIGNPTYLLRLTASMIVPNSFDSAGWWKAGGFGKIFLPQGSQRHITRMKRSNVTPEAIQSDILEIGHSCPFCHNIRNLWRSRPSRIQHNLVSFMETVSEIVDNVNP